MDYKISRTPKTNSDLKNSNIKRVFLDIQTIGPVLRRCLQKKTGLSWGSISLNINTLCEMGLIIESAQEETSVGRKPQSLDINPNNNYLIGLDVQMSMIRAVVTDLKGRVIAQYNQSLTYTDKNTVISDLYLLIDQILQNINGKKIISIGIAVQGIVSKDNTTSKFFPGFADWERVNLKCLIEDRYSIECFVFHDPDAIMCAEKLFRNAKEPSLRNVALIRLEDGVGLSIMINREIFTSGTGKSGEIGHINVEKNGLQCVCGDRGCLEPYVTSSGIVKRFISAVSQGEKTNIDFTDISDISINILATAAKNGDPLCKRLFMEMGEYLGIAMSSYINIFNPQLIIIEGVFTKYKDVFEQEMFRSIKEHVWYINETKIIFAEHNQFIAAVGVALACFEKIIIEANDFEQIFNGNALSATKNN
jgi:predicted NBD/HSP70 family sugar kinase